MAIAVDPFAFAADVLDPPLDPYAQDPALWANDVLGIHAWSRQREILESVRDHARTAARSGHGIGKTVTGSVAALWFLDTHQDSRVITTATNWSQIEAQLWHEIRQAHKRAPRNLDRPIFRVRADQPLTTRFDLPDGRYAIGLSSKPENSESFAGHHAPWILIICDEASGIDRRIFEVAEGYMTTAGARMLLLGNPTRTSGTFFDAFHSQRASYNCLHISALESPAVTGEEVPERARAALTGPDWIEDRKKAWGEESPMYQIRVLGNFAKTSDDTVIDLGLVEEAQERKLKIDIGVDLTVIGVDVARFGNDETVIAVRTAEQVRIADHYIGKPTTTTVAKVIEVANRYPRPAVRIVVDDPGVGGGVTDQLRAAGWPVTAFNGAATARNPRPETGYPNRRCELWFEGAARLSDLDLDKDEQLAADLTSPKYDFDLKQRRKVEPKAETKKRLGRSPDRADAVLLTLVQAEGYGAVSKPPRPYGPVELSAERRMSDSEIRNAPM